MGFRLVFGALERLQNRVDAGESNSQTSIPKPLAIFSNVNKPGFFFIPSS